MEHFFNVPLGISSTQLMNSQQVAQTPVRNPRCGRLGHEPHGALPTHFGQWQGGGRSLGKRWKRLVIRVKYGFVALQIYKQG